MDDEGLDPDALEAELERGGDVSFLYTIPTFQNPSGRTLSEERRRRIAELCRAHDLDVLEDDPYGLVRYEGTAPPALHALEGGEHVTFTSSFSKTVAPGLRVGWFVVPEALRERVRRPRRVDVHLAAAPAAGDRARALRARRLRPQPRADPRHPAGPARRDARPRSTSELAGRATWSRPEGGYFLWVDFGAGIDAGELLGRATEAGVTFVRGADFFPGGDGGGAPRGSRSPTRRPSGSPRASASSPGSSRPSS